MYEEGAKVNKSAKKIKKQKYEDKKKKDCKYNMFGIGGVFILYRFVPSGGRFRICVLEK
jgi:hypothetical protein